MLVTNDDSIQEIKDQEFEDNLITLDREQLKKKEKKFGKKVIKLAQKEMKAKKEVAANIKKQAAKLERLKLAHAVAVRAAAESVKVASDKLDQMSTAQGTVSYFKEKAAKKFRQWSKVKALIDVQTDWSQEFARVKIRKEERQET
jgi:hypothetical protein